MNTPTIGSIRPVAGQDDRYADPGEARGALAWLRSGKTLEPFRQRSPAPPQHPPMRAPAQAGAELLLNLAVKPAHVAVSVHGPQAHDKILHGTLALLASLAHADTDTAVAQARQVLQEQAALRALAVDYRSALQAG